MRLLPFCLSLLFLATTFAHSEECKLIKNNTKRLACYDENSKLESAQSRSTSSQNNFCNDFELQSNKLLNRAQYNFRDPVEFTSLLSELTFTFQQCQSTKPIQTKLSSYINNVQSFELYGFVYTVAVDQCKQFISSCGWQNKEPQNDRQSDFMNRDSYWDGEWGSKADLSNAAKLKSDFPLLQDIPAIKSHRYSSEMMKAAIQNVIRF